MKVQKAVIPDTEGLTWMVIDDDYLPVKPIEDFLVYCENIERSPNTVRAYAHHLKLFWEYLALADLDWREANRIDKLADFVVWLRYPASSSYEPLFLGQQEAKRQESTVNTILSAVASFYDYHERTGAVPQGSTSRLQTMPRQRYRSFLYHIMKSKPVMTKLVKLKEPKKRPKTLRPDEVQRLVDACRNARDRFLVSLLYHTGMRIGQALGLRHCDVQTWTNEIQVIPRQHNANRSRAKHDDPYTVHVPTELMVLYRDYVVNELGDTAGEYVFVNLWGGDVGQPMRYGTVISLFRRLSRRTGVEAHPHMLRHTHATELIRAGWDASYVQKRLGHARIQTTIGIYSHLDDEDLKQAYLEFQRAR
jgi:integrase/recombinase XerD